MKKYIIIACFMSLLLYGLVDLVFFKVYEIPEIESYRNFNLYKMDAINILIDDYKVIFNELPLSLKDLGKLNAHDLYNKEIKLENLKNSWGNDFYYKKNSQIDTGYQLCANGKDNEVGGKGENEDVCYFPTY